MQRPNRPHDLGRLVRDRVHARASPGLALSAPRLRALLEILEADGHDVVELREELAHLLRTLMRWRHAAPGFHGGR
jgi:hypothetical protein